MNKKGNIEILLKDFVIDPQPIRTFDIIIPQVIFNGIKEDKIVFDSMLFYDREICAWRFYTAKVESNFTDKDWTYFVNNLISKMKDLHLIPSLNHSLFILFQFINDELKKVSGNKNYGFEYFNNANAIVMKKATGELIHWNCVNDRAPFTRNN